MSSVPPSEPQYDRLDQITRDLDVHQIVWKKLPINGGQLAMVFLTAILGFAEGSKWALIVIMVLAWLHAVLPSDCNLGCILTTIGFWLTALPTRIIAWFAYLLWLHFTNRPLPFGWSGWGGAILTLGILYAASSLAGHLCNAFFPVMPPLWQRDYNHDLPPSHIKPSLISLVIVSVIIATLFPTHFLSTDSPSSQVAPTQYEQPNSNQRAMESYLETIGNCVTGLAEANENFTKTAEADLEQSAKAYSRKTNELYDSLREISFVPDDLQNFHEILLSGFADITSSADTLARAVEYGISDEEIRTAQALNESGTDKVIRAMDMLKEYVESESAQD